MSTNTKDSDKQKFVNDWDSVPSEYFVNLQGKKYILWAGLQYIMESRYGKGNYRIEPSCLSQKTNGNSFEVLFESKISIIPTKEYMERMGLTSMEDPRWQIVLKPFVGHATANSENTNSMMKKFAIALAETRANVRAMRLATGCPYTAVDELDRRDFKDKTKVTTPWDTELTVESLDEAVISEENTVVVLPANQMDRGKMITFIKQTMKSNKGVEAYVKSFLDRQNAMLIDNLSTDLIKGLYTGTTKMIGA